MIAARQGVIAKQTSFVNIILRSRRGYTDNMLAGYSVFYSTEVCDGWGAYPAINNCPNSEDCEQYGTLTIPANTVVYITVKECDGTYIKFNAVDDTDECPGLIENYCYDYGTCEGTPFSFNSHDVNKNISISVFIGNNGNYLSCGAANDDEEEQEE